MFSYFITGTDTNIGKTLVSCALLNALSKKRKGVVGMKPIATGCHETPDGLLSEDVEKLRAASDIKAHLSLVNPYAFIPPIAPHIAAQLTKTKIDLTVIHEAFKQLQNMAEAVIVEGIGGFKVPIDVRATTIDIVRTLQLPIILVVGVKLGCLNHALLTLDAIHSSRLRLEAWVANCIDPSMELVEENIKTLQQRIPAPLLGTIPFTQNLTPQKAASHLDIYRLSEIQIKSGPTF